MVKNPSANAEDVSSVPGGEDPLEVDRFAWNIPQTEEPGGLTVHGVTKNWTQLSTHTHLF